MDAALEPAALVATVFALRNDADPYLAFREFLHTHMVSFTSARTLKAHSSSDPLVVTEYYFTFESSISSDLAALRKSAYEWSKSAVVDVAIQVDDVFRRHKRLVVFDMDSTLIKQEVIDEIALHLDLINPQKNVGAKVAVSLCLGVFLMLGNHGTCNAGTNRFQGVVAEESCSPCWDADDCV
jgi:hypothetical protein